MAMKSPAQGRRAAPSSPQGRLQHEVHSIQMRCQETLRRAKARKVEMEQEEARRRIKMEGFRADIEENKRLREEAKLKEEERKRKEEKKLKLEMKKDVEKMIKGIEEARKDFKKLFKPTMEPRVHVSAVSNADSASLLSSVTQNDEAAQVPLPVPVVLHYEGEKKAIVVPVPGVSHQAACAPVPVPTGEKIGRKKNVKEFNLEIEATASIVITTQNDEGRVSKELDLDVVCRGESKTRKDIKMKALVPVMVPQSIQNHQELNLDTCQGDEKKEVEKKSKEKKEQQKMKHAFASTISHCAFMHHKSSFEDGDTLSSNEEDVDNSFDAFLESFRAPKWFDFFNLNDDEDDIAFFSQGDCSQTQSDVSSNEEDDEDSFDGFLDSFNDPQWVDFANLNDHDDKNDDIAFFCHSISDCSENHALERERIS